jgi:hypothetical protein
MSSAYNGEFLEDDTNVRRHAPAKNGFFLHGVAPYMRGEVV